MSPGSRGAPLEDAVGDEARNGCAHFARRTDSLELAGGCRALGDRLDNPALDASERRARQGVGRSRKTVRRPRLDSRHCGNHAAIGVGNRDHVVGREKLHQLQMRAIEQRARLEHFEDGFQIAGRKTFADLRDHARYLARAERREHAMTRMDEAVEGRRDRICQRLESARRSDDHNVGLHLDALCCQATYTARERRGESSGSQFADLLLSMPAFADASSLVESGHDAPISDCR